MVLLKLINKIGIFRLIFTPLACWILFTAYERQDWMMGLVGAVLLFFGLKNWCVMGGSCSVD
jgi:hypothetical protein